MKAFHRILAFKLPGSSAEASVPIVDTSDVSSRLLLPRLPPELWSHILSFLPDPEMLRISVINRLFYDMAMDRRYKHCQVPYSRGCSGSDLLRAVRNPSLAKRIKIVDISTSNLFNSRSVSAARRWQSQILRFLLPSSFRTRIPTIGSSRPTALGTHWQDVLSSKTKVKHILDILAMAENLQKLSLHLRPCENFALELAFVTSLSSLLCQCRSIYYLFLRLQYAKLDWVLPLMHFRGLREVHLYIYMRPRDVLPSPTVPGIFLRFLEVLKPSLEALTIRVFDYELIFQISQSLCHEGAIMPRVRELDTRLSLKSPHTFEAISMNYPSVTKLALTPVIDVEPLTFLENLRLPELRTLRLWLPGRTSGFWRGLSSSPLLDELCVTLAAPMQRDEVAELCRFFSHTKITRLSISVEVLDPRLVDFLAGYFPNLRDIALKAKHLMQPSWPFEEGYLSSFRDEMHERRYPKLRELERFSLSFLGADIPAEAVISVLAECLPGVEFKHGAMSFLSR